MKTAAVVVTFEPNLESFRKLLNSLVVQVEEVVIVDNSSSDTTRAFIKASKHAAMISLISLRKNHGIAFAQNAGIEKAKELGMTHVLLMDQDSLPADDMVQKLAIFFDPQLPQYSADIAAVGPVRIDNRNGHKSLFMTEVNGLPKLLKDDIVAEQDLRPIDVTYLIASGTLIPLSILEDVGGMKNEYFIDRVDTEWSFRAKAKGYSLIGVPDAKLYHTLGDKAVKFWFFGRRLIPWHSPLRHYYVFRNTILMIKDVKMPWVWKLHSVWRLVQLAGFFIVFAPERLRRIHMMGLGLLHGFKSVRGCLDENSLQCQLLSEKL